MKVNELMIGDWVLINEVPKKIQAVDGVDDEIMADDEMYCLAEDRYHSEDNVTGIPITPEILEKNGMKPFEVDRLRDKHSSAKWWSKGGDFFVKQYNFKHNDYEPTYSVGGNYHSLIIGLKYVHELQNALSLCGIEHDIKL